MYINLINVSRHFLFNVSSVFVLFILIETHWNSSKHLVSYFVSLSLRRINCLRRRQGVTWRRLTRSSCYFGQRKMKWTMNVRKKKKLSHRSHSWTLIHPEAMQILLVLTRSSLWCWCYHQTGFKRTPTWQTAAAQLPLTAWDTTTRASPSDCATGFSVSWKVKFVWQLKSEIIIDSWCFCSSNGSPLWLYTCQQRYMTHSTLLWSWLILALHHNKIMSTNYAQEACTCLYNDNVRVTSGSFGYHVQTICEVAYWL